MDMEVFITIGNGRVLYGEKAMDDNEKFAGLYETSDNFLFYIGHGDIKRVVISTAECVRHGLVLFRGLRKSRVFFSIFGLWGNERAVFRAVPFGWGWSFEAFLRGQGTPVDAVTDFGVLGYNG
jgi:hypothetical protein